MVQDRVHRVVAGARGANATTNAQRILSEIAAGSHDYPGDLIRGWHHRILLTASPAATTAGREALSVGLRRTGMSNGPSPVCRPTGLAAGVAGVSSVGPVIHPYAPIHTHLRPGGGGWIGG